MNDFPFANKSLGQHWLTDDTVLESIVDAAGVKATDTVLEIGPGLGTLTKHLLKRAKQVVAVEFDQALANKLAQQKLSDKLKVITTDILQFDLTSLPPDYKVVANIPYYLTSKLIRNLSETPNAADTVVILVQKEVAERVAAKSGNMSLLSVSAQFYWDVSLGIDVPAKLFIPPPKVDSKVLIMKRIKQAVFDDVDKKKYFQLVKAGFSSRRKTLLNSLSGGLRLDKDEINRLFLAAGLDTGLRPQMLSLEDWHKIYLVLYK